MCLQSSSRNRSALSPKTQFPGSGWIVEERYRVRLGPDERPVEASLLRSGSSRTLVYHWREGAGSWPREALRSFLALDRSPFRQSGEMLVVRIGAAVLG